MTMAYTEKVLKIFGFLRKDLQFLCGFFQDYEIQDSRYSFG